MMTLANNVLFIFVKYPDSGKVKTRLAKSTGPERAAALYADFVEEILKKLTGARNYDISLCISDKNDLSRFQNWLGAEREYTFQNGNDLGERMANCFQEAFAKNIDSAIIIGTDSPDLPPAYIDTAFHSLSHHDMVIGPAEDGGYYLIGFRKSGFNKTIFQNIRWSTATVYADTLTRTAGANLTLFQLPQWHDIDTIEDLKKYLRKVKRS